MLKYTHGLKYDFVPMTSSEHIYVPRTPDKDQSDINERFRSRSPSARTFWKSPYAGNSNLFRNGSPVNRNIFLKQELTINTTPYQSRSPSRQASGTVKGILKNKDGGETNHATLAAPEDITPRGAYGKPNLITTGTSDPKPHGAKPETKSAAKRVQFNNLPKQSVQSKNNFLNLPIGTATSHRGRRLYFNRTLAVRVLGSPNRCEKYGGNGRLNGFSTDRYMATTSLNSGESYIKSQINDFVRKLRLAESAKKARNENSGPRISSGRGPRNSQWGIDDYNQWQEFDIERSQTYSEFTGNASGGNNQNSVQRDSECKEDVTDSSSVSLESLESPSGTNIAESTPGGAEIYRKKAPMAALFTKYRHITNNQPDLKRYEKKSVVTSTRTKTEKPKKKSLNFCDTDKTSQILGWLEDMKLAQGSNDGNKDTARNKTPVDQDEQDPVTRVAQANSVAQSVEQSNTS